MTNEKPFWGRYCKEIGNQWVSIDINKFIHSINVYVDAHVEILPAALSGIYLYTYKFYIKLHQFDENIYLYVFDFVSI